jgi:hypothetical protein
LIVDWAFTLIDKELPAFLPDFDRVRGAAEKKRG